MKENSDEVSEDKKTSSSMADWLKLNVGGTIYETSRSTLTSDSESILARMFEPNSSLPPATVTEEGCYQIDACPKGFGVVLNWLRYTVAARRGGDHRHQRQVGGLQSRGRRILSLSLALDLSCCYCDFHQMSTVASGMDDLWRLKCELSNISGILSNGFKNLK